MVGVEIKRVSEAKNLHMGFNSPPSGPDDLFLHPPCRPGPPGPPTVPEAPSSNPAPRRSYPTTCPASCI